MSPPPPPSISARPHYPSLPTAAASPSLAAIANANRESGITTIAGDRRRRLRRRQTAGAAASDDDFDDESSDFGTSRNTMVESSSEVMRRAVHERLAAAQLRNAEWERTASAFSISPGPSSPRGTPRKRFIRMGALDPGTYFECASGEGANSVVGKDVTDKVGRPVFVKVAAKVHPVLDSPVLDAANSVVVADMQELESFVVSACDVRSCVYDDDTGKARIVDDAGASHLAIAYDLVKGETLHNSRPASVGEVSKALAHLFRKMAGIAPSVTFLHNDLHPGNVMMDASHTLRIIDYGRVLVDHVQYTMRQDLLEGIASPRDITCKYNPFESDVARSYAEHYWLADVMTLSMNVTAHFESELGSFDGIFNGRMIEFRDADALLRLANTINDTLKPVFPGVVLFTLMHMFYKDNVASRHDPLLLAYRNFVLTKSGGTTLLAMLNSGWLENEGYSGVLTEAFHKGWGMQGGDSAVKAVRSALYGRAERHGAGSGGSGPAELTFLDDGGALAAYVPPANIFPRSQFEAATTPRFQTGRIGQARRSHARVVPPDRALEPISQPPSFSSRSDAVARRVVPGRAISSRIVGAVGAGPRASRRTGPATAKAAVSAVAAACVALCTAFASPHSTLTR